MVKLKDASVYVAEADTEWRTVYDNQLVLAYKFSERLL